MAEVVDWVVAALCMVGDRLILYNEEKKETMLCQEEIKLDRRDRDHKRDVV